MKIALAGLKPQPLTANGSRWREHLTVSADPKKYGLELRAQTSPAADAYHNNFLACLGVCWKNHYGVTLTPDLVWYTLMCEVAGLVKSNPERYRHLFSTTQEKQQIIIVTGELVVMPLEHLAQSLQAVIPSDGAVFLPRFSTTTPASHHAHCAAFADACSPYYDYGMMLCGLPSVDILGSKDDWQIVTTNWRALMGLLQEPKEWLVAVEDWLNQILKHLGDQSVTFWKDIFWLEKCGSGSQVEVRGWWAKVYREQPSPAYDHNFATHISLVDYRQIETEKDYQMKVGLFHSQLVNGALVPDFSSAIFEKVAPRPEKSRDWSGNVGDIPIRQDITVLPADDPRKISRLNWGLDEEIGIIVVNDAFLGKFEVPSETTKVKDAGKRKSKD